MSATTYTVTGTVPTPVHASGYPSPITVYNQSTTAVLYLVEEPTNNGFPLNPGSMISWDAKKPLYLYTDTGQTVPVALVDNAGNFTDSKAIAQQIVATGLAQDIADAIAASSLAASIGDEVPIPPSAAAIGAAVDAPTAAEIGAAVPVPPSAAAIGSAVPVPPSAAAIGAAVDAPTATEIAGEILVYGAPPINTLTVLASDTRPVDNTGLPAGLGGIDTTGYQSVIVSILENGPSWNGTDAPKLREILLTWKDGNGNPTEQERFVSMDNCNSGATLPGIAYETSVKDVDLTINIPINASTFGNITTKVIGSYRTVTLPRYINRSRYKAGGLVTHYGNADDGFAYYYIANKNTSTLLTSQPPSRNGPCSLRLGADSITVAGTIYILDASNLAIRYAQLTMPISGLPIIADKEFRLPPRPITIYLDAAIRGTNIYASITWG